MSSVTVRGRAIENGARRFGSSFLSGLDRGLIAVIVALAAFACIFALAGAAFAVRALLVLCFATLAGRGRRIGVPALAETIPNPGRYTGRYSRRIR